MPIRTEPRPIIRVDGDAVVQVIQGVAPTVSLAELAETGAVGLAVLAAEDAETARAAIDAEAFGAVEEHETAYDHAAFLDAATAAELFDAIGAAAAAFTAASAALVAHESAPNPHPAYLTLAEGEGAFDAIGAAAAAQLAAEATAASALSAHVGAPDPHPGYLLKTEVAETGAAKVLRLTSGGRVNTSALEGLVPGLSGLSPTPNRLAYWDAGGAPQLWTLTAAGLALLDDADDAAQRATLGLVIGSQVQAYSGELAAVAGVSTTGAVRRTGTATWTAGTLPVSEGGTGATSEATARAALNVDVAGTAAAAVAAHAADAEAHLGLGARYDIEAMAAGGYTDLGLSDECDSGSIDAQWIFGGTTVSGTVSLTAAPSTPIVDAVTRDGSYLLQSSAGAVCQIGLAHTIAEGEQIIFALSGASAEGSTSANEAQIGIALSSSATGYSSGNHDWVYWDGGNEEWDHWQGSTATQVLRTAQAPPSGDLYFRLFRPSGEQFVYWAISINRGRTWTKLHRVNTVTRGHTHIWVFVKNSGMTGSAVPGINELAWVRHLAFNGAYDPW